MRIPLYIYVLFLTFIIGCKKHENTANVVNHWIDKKIELPSEQMFRNEKKKSFKSFISKNQKILTVIDGDCSSCVQDLKKWREFMFKIDTSKVSVFFIIHSYDNLQTFKYFDSTEINFKYPYFFDNNKKYIRNNQFPIEKKFQTFLLNNENKVSIIGNPILNKKINELYFKNIK